MSDITLCGNKECPKAAHCLRATTAPGYWQSYGYWHPKTEPEFHCEGYLANSKGGE